MAKKDLQFSIGVLLLCALMYIGTFSIKITKTVSVSAAYFPRLILAITAVLAVIYMYFALKALKNSTAKEKEKEEKKDIKSLLLTMGTFIVYGVLVDILGFVIASIGYLIVQMWVMLEVKNKKELIKFTVISVISTVLVYYVFTRLFYVSLPSGSLF
jgi:putative tricarboxylic transport membrane protein